MSTPTDAGRSRGRPPAAGSAARCRAAAAAALALLLLPAPAHAQEADGDPTSLDPPWTVGVRLGPSSPRGALGELTTNGWIGGLAVERRFLGRGLLRAEAAFEGLDSGGAPATLGGAAGPEVQLYHYTAGLGVELTDPVVSRWDLSLLGGVGATYLVSENSPALPDFTGQRPTVRLSARAGYDFSPSVTLYLRADAYQLVDDPSAPGPLSDAHTLLAHSAELRIGF